MLSSELIPEDEIEAEAKNEATSEEVETAAEIEEEVAKTPADALYEQLNTMLEVAELYEKALEGEIGIEEVKKIIMNLHQKEEVTREKPAKKRATKKKPKKTKTRKTKTKKKTTKKRKTKTSSK